MKVVCWLAGVVRASTEIPPLPLIVKLEVTSCSCLWKMKTSEHVKPAYEAGRSKLKMDETVDEIWPKWLVPAAWLGWFLSTGIIR